MLSDTPVICLKHILSVYLEDEGNNSKMLKYSNIVPHFEYWCYSRYKLKDEARVYVNTDFTSQD